MSLQDLNQQLVSIEKYLSESQHRVQELKFAIRSARQKNYNLHQEQQQQQHQDNNNNNNKKNKSRSSAAAVVVSSFSSFPFVSLWSDFSQQLRIQVLGKENIINSKKETENQIILNNLLLNNNNNNNNNNMKKQNQDEEENDYNNSLCSSSSSSSLHPGKRIEDLLQWFNRLLVFYNDEIFSKMNSWNSRLNEFNSRLTKCQEKLKSSRIQIFVKRDLRRRSKMSQLILLGSCDQHQQQQRQEVMMMMTNNNNNVKNTNKLIEKALQKICQEQTCKNKSRRAFLEDLNIRLARVKQQASSSSF